MKHAVIAFYQYPDYPDGYGGSFTEPILYWSTRAEVKPVASKREQGENEINNAFQFILRFRKDKAIDHTMSLQYKGKFYTIDSIVNVNEENRFLKVTAKARGEAQEVALNYPFLAEDAAEETAQ